MRGKIIEKYKELHEACKKYPKINLSSRWGENPKPHKEQNNYARENISDEKELQEFLDKWCDKQTGTTTYYPCYKEYVRVKKEWFD